MYYLVMVVYMFTDGVLRETKCVTGVLEREVNIVKECELSTLEWRMYANDAVFVAEDE